MILSQSQANAVYTAMVAMNDVNGYVDIQMTNIRVFENGDGTIVIYGKRSLEGSALFETHPSQDAFAKFYKIVL